MDCLLAGSGPVLVEKYEEACWKVPRTEGEGVGGRSASGNVGRGEGVGRLQVEGWDSPELKAAKSKGQRVETVAGRTPIGRLAIPGCVPEWELLGDTPAVFRKNVEMFDWKGVVKHF
jgi:hypothetical protein